MNSVQRFSVALYLMCFAIGSSALPLPNKNNILILGDSISAGYGIDANRGWASLLSDKIDSDYSQWQVINASISGNTTGDGLARLPKLLQTYSPKVVVLELGGNDGLRGHPLKRIRANLAQLIDLSRDAGAEVLLLGIEIPPNYGQRYTDEFRASLQQTAKEQNVAFDPFVLEGIALDPEMMQDDGIHPTQSAQPALLDNIWPHLKPLLVIDSI